MPRTNVHLSSFSILSAALFAFQAGASQTPQSTPQNSLITIARANPASLVLELDRAIYVLERGLKEHWPTRDEYLTAFEQTPGRDSTARSVTNAEGYVHCAIDQRLPTYQIWGEAWPKGPSLEIEVQRTITEFTKLRSRAEQAKAVRRVRFPVPPCSQPAP